MKRLGSWLLLAHRESLRQVKRGRLAVWRPDELEPVDRQRGRYADRPVDTDFLHSDNGIGQAYGLFDRLLQEVRAPSTPRMDDQEVGVRVAQSVLPNGLARGEGRITQRSYAIGFAPHLFPSGRVTRKTEAVKQLSADEPSPVFGRANTVFGVERIASGQSLDRIRQSPDVSLIRRNSVSWQAGVPFDRPNTGDAKVRSRFPCPGFWLFHWLSRLLGAPIRIRVKLPRIEKIDLLQHLNSSLLGH